MLEYVTANLDVHECNVSAHPHVQGLPPMTAYAGLAHALERALHTAGREDVEMIGVAPFISRVSVSRRMVPLAPQKQTHRSRAAKGARLAPKGQKIAQIRLGLAFAIESDTGVAGLVSDATLARVLARRRLSGGTLWLDNHGLHCRQHIDNALRDMPAQAFAIEDRTQELCDDAEAGEDRLDTLVRLIRRSRCGEGGGMRMPVGIGYVALDRAPVARGDTRNRLPHVFAEPVIGLARPRLVMSLRKAVRDARARGEDIQRLTDRIFWQYRALVRRGRDLTVRSLNHVYGNSETIAA